MMIQTAPVSVKKVITEGGNQYTLAKENVKSPCMKRTNSPVREKSAAVGDPADKKVRNNPKTTAMDIKIGRNRKTKVRGRNLIDMPLKLKDMILNLKVN